MGIVIWIIVGAIAGFVASKVLTGKGMGLLWDIVVGILGAFLGGWLAGLAGIPVSTGTFSISGLLAAFVGARQGLHHVHPRSVRLRLDQRAPEITGHLFGQYVRTLPRATQRTRLSVAGGRPATPNEKGFLGVEHPAVGERSENDQENHGAHEGGEEPADRERPSADGDADEACQPAAQERSQDADHDVPQQAHAFAAEHLARDEPGDRADDDPDQNAHVFLNL